MNEYSDPYSKKIKRQALVDFIYLANPRIKIPTSIELDDLRGIAAQYVSKGERCYLSLPVAFVSHHPV